MQMTIEENTSNADDNFLEMSDRAKMNETGGQMF